MNRHLTLFWFLEHPVGLALLDELHSKVFAALIGPALLNRDEHRASAAALLTADLLDLARGPTRDSIVSLLLGDPGEDDADAPDSLVWTAVCRRVTAPLEVTARAALQVCTYDYIFFEK